jgi:N-methylhydantoinase A
MPAATVADGQVTISAKLAEEAVRRVAEPLGLTLLETASGIHRIANARMTRALRSVSSEKGRDPRDFALIAYGGAGPIHAAGLAEDLGMRTVVVPAVAGLFSAVGLLFARPEFHEVRTCNLVVDAVDPAVVAGLFAEMQATLAGSLAGRSVEWVRTADLRYGGQSWEVEVELRAGPIDDPLLGALRARFEDEHKRLYGVKDRAGSPVEIRALRLAALGEAASTRSFQLEATAATSNGATRRIDGAVVPVRTRSSIGGAPEAGPLLVDEYDTTVVVPPGWSARRDAATGALVLERGSDGD